MVDLSKIQAAEMAGQLARPSGEIGVAVGDYMNRLNSLLISAVYARLRPPPDGQVLEIGFGNGKLIGHLMRMAPNLSYVGVDISETMVDEAGRNNQTLVEQGRVKLRLAAVE